ncbi:hypothetical protein VPH35_038810 [Triticum aestivum]
MVFDRGVIGVALKLFAAHGAVVEHWWLLVLDAVVADATVKRRQRCRKASSCACCKAAPREASPVRRHVAGGAWSRTLGAIWWCLCCACARGGVRPGELRSAGHEVNGYDMHHQTVTKAAYSSELSAGLRLASAMILFFLKDPAVAGIDFISREKAGNNFDQVIDGVI